MSSTILRPTTMSRISTLWHNDPFNCKWTIPSIINSIRENIHNAYDRIHGCAYISPSYNGKNATHVNTGAFTLGKPDRELVENRGKSPNEVSFSVLPQCDSRAQWDASPKSCGVSMCCEHYACDFPMLSEVAGAVPRRTWRPVGSPWNVMWLVGGQIGFWLISVHNYFVWDYLDNRIHM